MISSDAMTELFKTLNMHDVPMTYLDHAIVTDLEGKEHALTPLEYAALATRDRPLLFTDVRLTLDGNKMTEALRHEMNAIYWPWGWAS